MKEKIIGLIFAIIGVTVIGLFILYSVDQLMNHSCNWDKECVPEQCCHPISCVPTDEAPNCLDTICTEECAPGTMDCGQGFCECRLGKCKAVIDNPLERFIVDLNEAN